MVQLKRTSVAPRVEEPAQESTAEDVAARRGELEAEGRAQLAANRDVFRETLTRLARGIELWNERGWTWEEPNWTLPPEQWPPLARLLRLFVVANEASANAMMLRHFPGHPRWCEACHPGEDRPAGYAKEWCLEHIPAAAVGTLARDVLGVTTWEGK